MSLMKTLARVAAGVMLAKGVGAVMNSRQQGGRPDDRRIQQEGRDRQGGGGLLDDLLGNNTAGTSGGSFSERLGEVLSGGRGQSGHAGAQSGRGAVSPAATAAACALPACAHPRRPEGRRVPSLPLRA